MAKWLLLIITLMLLVSPACANGAMGMVYGTFAWNYWLVYVAITVLFEAVVFGRWANMELSKALSTSLGANALTGLLGTVFSGFFGYMFYNMGGRSYVEPNPLGHALFCLGVGATFSALIESIIWTKAAGGAALRTSLLVHLASIPLALLILLLPARPYEGLEGQARSQRGHVRNDVARAIDEEILPDGAEPFIAPTMWKELLQRIQPVLSRRYNYSPQILEVSGYQPHFFRFDTGESFRHPAQFNAALTGRDLRKLEKPEWLVRWTTNGWSEGIVVNDNGICKYVGNLSAWIQNRDERAKK